MKNDIVFSYEVINGSEIIAQETITVTLSEKEIRQVASAMDGNGGQPIEMGALVSRG